MQTQQIVSLIPSGTEIICALGFEQQLIGRSHECDYPASVQRLPTCTRPKFNTVGTSAEISARVSAILRDALSVYDICSDVLEQLAPEVIVTQSQCEVCAVTLSDLEQFACDLLNPSARLVALEPNTLADVFHDIQQVANALDVSERGARLVEMLHGRMNIIAEQTRSLSYKPTVACIEWLDPIMAAGNWMPELVERAGGINLFGEMGKHSPWMQWDELAAQDPDIIVLMPCGFGIPRASQDIPILESRMEWASLKAVRNGRVYVTDGNQYFSRPGPRLVESVEILAEILHPDRFSFGHQGTGWESVYRTQNL